MAHLISKQKTRLGPRGGPHTVYLSPGVPEEVDDDAVDELLAWGKGGGRRLERAGILRVVRAGERLEAPKPTAEAGAEQPAPDPRLDSVPDTLADLTVRKARPFIDAAEDLELVRKWATVEASGQARAGILDPLEQRFLELGGEASSDEGGDEGEGDGG